MQESGNNLNLEILSKIVMNIKTSQIETTKKILDEILNLKNENNKSVQEIQIKSDTEVNSLKEEFLQQRIKSEEKEKFYLNEINNLKSKFESTILELREDMLKLLHKYEEKFQIQDEEIEVLKNKCEMTECKICNFQSFKVHFQNCEECGKLICTDCLLVCDNCRKTKCGNCLIKCNNCMEKFCTDCTIKCTVCNYFSNSSCYDNCQFCEIKVCKKCESTCRGCNKLYCFSEKQDNISSCAAFCDKCKLPVSCQKCSLNENFILDKCLCGKLYCNNCEDECLDCTENFSWLNESKIFQGFHTISKIPIPNKCLIKFFICQKGNDTTHLGLTIDKENMPTDKATDNFWSLCLNSGEKFSTLDYKKKGITWMKYAVPVKAGDLVYIKFFDGEINYFINRKEFPIAFKLDKNISYYVYCLTHDDSTQVEIKSLKIFK